jgi:hypothetical protein
MKKVDRWKMEMPTEQEMLPKDKYTVFDRKVKRYRKGIHSELLLVCKIEIERAVDVIGLCVWTAARRLGHGQTKCSCEGTNADHLQRCPSGQESARDSTLLVSERKTAIWCTLHVSLRSASAMALFWNQKHPQFGHYSCAYAAGFKSLLM